MAMKYPAQILRHIPNEAIIPYKRDFTGNRWEPKDKGRIVVDLEVFDSPGLIKNLELYRYPISEVKVGDEVHRCLNINIMWNGEFEWQLSNIQEIKEGHDSEGRPNTIRVYRENAGMFDFMNFEDALLSIKAYDWTKNGRSGTSIKVVSFFGKPNAENPKMEMHSADPLLSEFHVLSDSEELPFK